MGEMVKLTGLWKQKDKQGNTLSDKAQFGH